MAETKTTSRGKISPFTYSSDVKVNTPVVLDPEVGAIQGKARVDALNKLFNINATQADMAAQEATRYAVEYNNMQTKQKVLEMQVNELIPQDSLDPIILEGANQEQTRLLRLNEAQRLDKLPSMEKMYLSQVSMQLQEGQLYASQDAERKSGPNGEGYLETMNQWFNDQIPMALASAPSEKSRLEMLDRLTNYKLQSVKNGISLEDQKTKANTLATAKKVTDSLTKQAMLHPENYSAYLQQVAESKEAMLAAGLDPQVIDNFDIEAKSTITKGFADAITARDPEQGLDLLANSDIVEHLSSDSVLDLTKRSMDGIQKKMKEDADKFLTQQAINKVEMNLPLDPKSKEDKKVLDDYYTNLTSNLRDPQTGLLQDNPQGISEALQYMLSKNSTMLPEKLSADIRSGIMGGSPEQQLIYGRIVNNLSGDPRYHNLVNTLDRTAVDKGTIIARSVDSGMSLEDAVSKADRKFEIERNDLFKTRAQEANKLINMDTAKDAVNSAFTDLSNIIFGFGARLSEGKANADELYAKTFDAKILDRAASDYKELYTDHYARTGDESLANEYAVRMLKKSYSTTSVNGVGEVMFTAPDLVFPGRGAEFNKQVFKQMYALNGVTDGDLQSRPATIPVDGVQREWSIDSIDQFNRNVAISNKVYAVYYTDDSGIKKPYLLDNGMQAVVKYEDGVSAEDIEILEHARAQQKEFEDFQAMRKQGAAAGLEAIQAVLFSKNATPEQLRLYKTLRGN